MPELGVAQSLPFGEILDAADRLTAAEQEALVAILRRRLAERGRKRIAADIAESRQEFKSGACRPAIVDELLDEIQS